MPTKGARIASSPISFSTRLPFKSTTPAATPGEGKGLPPQAHGKAKGHARPGPAGLPPGQAKDKAHGPKPPKPNAHGQDNQAGAGSSQAQ